MSVACVVLVVWVGRLVKWAKARDRKVNCAVLDRQVNCAAGRAGEAALALRIGAARRGATAVRLVLVLGWWA